MSAMPEPDVHPDRPARAAQLTEDSLRGFLDAFYAKVRRDREIGPIFAAVIAEDAWPGHIEKIGDFWSSVLLKSGRYKGNPFAAHVGKSIRPEYFTRWLEIFDEMAAEHFDAMIATAISGRAHAIGASLRAGLFFHAKPVSADPANC